MLKKKSVCELYILPVETLQLMIQKYARKHTHRLTKKERLPWPCEPLTLFALNSRVGKCKNCKTMTKSRLRFTNSNYSYDITTGIPPHAEQQLLGHVSSTAHWGVLSEWDSFRKPRPSNGGPLSILTRCQILVSLDISLLSWNSLFLGEILQQNNW